MTREQLDEILRLQIAVAWAGEGATDPPRLGWWRTAMCDEFGGEDLLKRLTPKTWRWTTLESARAAARRVDDRARMRAEDPDHLLTLFRLGFEVDEQLDERLLELKQSGADVDEIFPDFAELSADWSPDKFEAWLASDADSGYSATATGRRLKGQVPENLCDAAKLLTAALLPIDDEYVDVLPHFRTSR